MSFGIKHIPEVKHHKDGEEEAKFVSRNTVVCTPCEREYIGQRCYVVMLEVKQECQTDESKS